MITFIGIVLFVVSLTLYVLDKLNKSREEKNNIIESANSQNTNTNYLNELKFIVPLPNFAWWIPSVIAILLLTFNWSNPIGRNAYSYRQVVENPLTGATWVQFEQGIYFKGFWSKTTTYPDAVTVIYSRRDNGPTEQVSSLNPPVEIRFSDAAKADSEATVKWRLSNNEMEMLLTHKDNRSSQHLTETMLEPYTSECLGFAAQLMESETHYSGGKSKMAEDFQTQLEEGQYIIVTKAEYIQDSTSNTQRKITTTDIRRDSNDIPIRKKSNIKQYGITLVTATIKSVDYDEIIDEKLKSKIEASTRESISKQEAITAEQEAITAKTQGEKLIAETTAREDAAKLEAVIRAEKEAEVAAQNLKRDKLNAEAQLAVKRANAEGDRLKVIAGLSPQEKAEWDYKKHVDGMRALADGMKGTTWPNVMSFGGGEGSPTNPMEAIGLNFMLELNRKASQQK